MYKKAFIALLVCGLLTALLAACGIRDTAGPAGPTVHMGNASFLQDSITISKGQSVALIDDVPVPHTVVNGSWVNGAQQPATESGAPAVNLTFTGNDSSSAGPFNTAGTFHLYCTIHTGMNLTVVVQ